VPATCTGRSGRQLITDIPYNAGCIVNRRCSASVKCQQLALGFFLLSTYTQNTASCQLCWQATRCLLYTILYSTASAPYRQSLPVLIDSQAPALGTCDSVTHCDCQCHLPTLAVRRPMTAAAVTHCTLCAIGASRHIGLPVGRHGRHSWSAACQ